MQNKSISNKTVHGIPDTSDLVVGSDVPAGDLTGTYDAPVLATIVTAGDAGGDPPKVPFLTIDAKGRVVAYTAYSMTPEDIGATALGHDHTASDISSGLIPRVRGGLQVDAETTGGTGHVFKQGSVGGTITTAQVATADVANDAITYAKIQNVAASRLVGNGTGGAADMQEITVGAGLTLSSGSLIGNINALTVVLGSDYTNSTTSFTNVTGLSFSIAANSTYWFKFVVAAQTPATTTGYTLACTGPTSPTTFTYITQVATTSTAQGDQFGNGDDATATATPSVTAANTKYYSTVEGLLKNAGNSGTLMLRGKSEVSSSALTIKTGSLGWLVKVA